MGTQSAIEWTDSTFNGWEGCTKVGPGCDHCYAEVRNARFGGGASPNWGAGAPRRRTSAANWRKPVTWNAQPYFQCPCCGERNTIAEFEKQSWHTPGTRLEPARRRVFCSSLADWLDNEVPIEWLVDLLDLIRRTPHLDCLLLTKRISNWHKRITAAHQHIIRAMGGGGAEQNGHLLWDTGLWLQAWLSDRPPANIWIGATVVNQAEADRDVPKLLQVPALVRFLSIEPMLGAVDLMPMLEHRAESHTDTGIHWIICGGESGPKARPMHPDWARSLRDQCAAAGVPFLFKQWGEWAPGECGQPMKRAEDCATLIDDDKWDFDRITVAESQDMHRDDEPDVYRMGKKSAGRKLDGIEHNGFPK